MAEGTIPGAMARYVVRRVAYLVPIWLLISRFAFLLAGLAPGDPAEVLLRPALPSAWWSSA